MSELKPCPFCGSEADIEGNGRNAWAVQCTNENCGVFLPVDSWYTSRKIAIYAWNTRHVVAPDGFLFTNKGTPVKVSGHTIEESE